MKKLMIMTAPCIVAAVLAGCLPASPASRATSASYQITVKVCMEDGVKNASVSCPVKFGDGAIASADSAGSTETQTATPTLDVKPDVNLNYAQGGSVSNKSGKEAAKSLLGSLTPDSLKKLKGYLKNKKTGKVELEKQDGTTVTADCADGNCTYDSGSGSTTFSADDCADCELPGWVE